MKAQRRRLADRLRWYWRLQSRIDAFQVRWLGTSLLALMRRSTALVLETTGRRTGRPHGTTVMYWTEGDQTFIGGGAAGMSKVDWVANLRADPRCAVWVRRRRSEAEAHELRGDAYDKAKAYAFARWPAASRFEAGSGRRIPYFRLEKLP